MILTALPGQAATRKDVLLESLEVREPARHHSQLLWVAPVALRLRALRDGEQEFHDLRNDPYQLQNLARRAPNAMDHMRDTTKELCTPTQPGYDWSRA